MWHVSQNEHVPIASRTRTALLSPRLLHCYRDVRCMRSSASLTYHPISADTWQIHHRNAAMYRRIAQCHYMKNSPHCWPFVSGIHRRPVDSPRKRPVMRTFQVSFDVIMDQLLNKLSICMMSSTVLIWKKIINNTRIMKKNASNKARHPWQPSLWWYPIFNSIDHCT